MEGQLTAIAEIDGAHLSELILELADSRPGCADHQTLPTEAGIEIPCGQTFLASVLLVARGLRLA